jgi:hypothetical protein
MTSKGKYPKLSKIILIDMSTEGKYISKQVWNSFKVAKEKHNKRNNIEHLESYGIACSHER